MPTNPISKLSCIILKNGEDNTIKEESLGRYLRPHAIDQGSSSKKIKWTFCIKHGLEFSLKLYHHFLKKK